jgi:ribosomal protein L37AE/L43A
MGLLLTAVSVLMGAGFFWLCGWFMGRQHEHKVGTPSASHNNDKVTCPGCMKVIGYRDSRGIIWCESCQHRP